MPQNPGYKAIAVVSLMLLAGVPFANPEAARDAGTLSTFSDGATEVSLTFPEGGGWNNSTSVTLPANVKVTGANVTLTPGAVTRNGSLVANASELVVSGTIDNLTLRGDNLTLAEGEWNWSETKNTGFNFSLQNGTRIVADGVQLDYGDGRWQAFQDGATPRSYHSAVWDSTDNQMIIFGGTSSPTTWENDVWTYSPTSGHWIKKSSGSTQRMLQSSVWDSSDNRMLVFGGDAFGSGIMNDLWSYDPLNDSWAQKSSGATPRRFSTAIWNPDNLQMLVFGGYGNSVLNDLWAYSPSKDLWSRKADCPVPLMYHSAVWNSQDHQMIVFGGMNMTMSNQTWAYDPVHDTWLQKANAPMIRAEHSAVWDTQHDEMLVFGGSEGNYYLDELWAYSPGTDTWKQKASGATGRIFPTAVWDSQNNQMLVFGGLNGSNRLSDPWAYKIGYRAAGTMTSPTISTPLAAFGTLNVNISTPPGTRYYVDILDNSTNSIFQSSLVNNDPVKVRAQEHPVIRLRLTMATSNLEKTPILSGWGIGTSVKESNQQQSIDWTFNNTEITDTIRLAKNHDELRLTQNYSVSSGASTQQYPSVATGANDNVMIAWEDHRNGGAGEIYVRSMAPNGSMLGPEVPVITGGLNAESPKIAYISNGNFVLVWQTNRAGNYDIYAQRINSKGEKIGQEIIVSAAINGQQYPSVAADSYGNFVVTWFDYRNGNPDIYAQRFDSYGNKVGLDIAVCTLPSSQSWPTIAIDKNGQFTITWYDSRSGASSDIYAQRFDRNGDPIGGDIPVCTAPYDQLNPSIVVNSKNDIIICWMDYRNVSDYDVYCQRFKSDGSKLGPEILVSDAIHGQMYPTISVGSSDQFVITWEDNRNLSTWDIYAQLLDADGNKQGTDLQVTNEPANQQRPFIAVDSKDNFTIVWQDDRNGPLDIFAKTLFHPYQKNGYSISPVWNLGHPAKMGNISYAFTQPVQSGLYIYYRTSPDNLTWPPWSMYSGFPHIYYPPDPYIQVRADFQSLTPLRTPTFCFESLHYTLFVKSGASQPEPVKAPGNISKMTISISGSENNGTWSVMASTDGGTSWQPVENNQPVQFTNSTDEIFILIRMIASPDGESPVIQSISVSYDHDSYPSELQIVFDGCHATLRPYQQETLADIKDLFGDCTNNTTAEPQLVTLSVYSATAGTLRLSGLNISFETINPINQPPVISDPSPPDNSIINTSSVVLNWTATDPENDPLTFDFIMDGILQVSNASRPYTLVALSPGTSYSWQIRANDTHQTVYGPVWHFTVAQSGMDNNPPNITLVYPLNNSVVNSTTGSVRFEWRAFDQENDPLTYELYFDLGKISQITIPTNSTNYTIMNLVTNTVYQWKVIVMDKLWVVRSETWSFTYKLLTNRPPAFLTTDLPRATAGKDYRFRLAANDPDNDSLVFTLVSGPEGMTIDPGGNLSWRPPGGHTYQFTVNVTDGVNNVSKTFDLAVKWGGEVGPPPFYMTDEFPAFLIVVLAVIGIITGLIVARSRKPTRSRPSPETTPESIPDLSAQTAISIMSQPIVTPSIILPGPAARTEPAAPQPIIDDIFLVYRDGRLISHNTRKLKPDSDDSVLASMFTAVQEFVKDSFAEDESAHINEISYGENKILIEHGKSLFMAAVVSGEGTRRMHEQMKAAVYNIEQECSPALVKWSGEAKELKESKKWIKALIDGQNIETAATTPAPVKAAASPIVAPTQAPRPPVEAATTTPPASSQQPEMGSLPLPEELVEEEAKTMPKTVQKPITTPPATAAPAYWETALGGGNVATPSSPPKAETVPGLPAGATRIVNPFREETMALKTLSNIPRGLPGSLSGRSMDELAEELVLAQFAESADGDIIVKLGKKWYFGDPKQADTYLQPYKQS
jgi:N-acetylneuraminic acid mutarotase